MNGKERLFFLMLIIAFFSCQSSQSAWKGKSISVPSTAIILQQLQVDNFSETLTGNDEILLSIFFMIERNGQYSIEQAIHHPPHTFSKEGEILELSDEFLLSNFPSDAICVFTLVELDEEDSTRRVEKALDTYLTTGDFLVKVDQKAINTLLVGDDLLGLQFFEINSFKKGQPLKIIFKGRHLFDRYQYVLSGST